MKFKTFKEIVEILRDILKEQTGERVFDRDIAKALGCNKDVIACRKARNSITWEELLIFCKKNDLDVNEIVFEEGL